MENTPLTPATGGLTAAQEAFALEFVRTRNQRAAYRAAYAITEMNSKTLGKRAREVFDTPEVKARIAELIDAAAAPVGVTITAILDRLWKIATADPNEIMSIQAGACRYCHGEGHLYQWKLREYDEAMERAERLNEQEPTKDHPFPDPGGGFDYDHTNPPHPNCPECRGEGLRRLVVSDTRLLSPEARLLFQGVKETANGLEIRMADQTRALELAGKIVGAFKDDSPKVLQVELKALGAVVNLEAKDPISAARMYQDMIAGRPPKE